MEPILLLRYNHRYRSEFKFHAVGRRWTAAFRLKGSTMVKVTQKKKSGGNSVFGLELTPWIVRTLTAAQSKSDGKKGSGSDKKASIAKIVVLGEQQSPEQHFRDLGIPFTEWMRDRFNTRRNEPLLMTSEFGPVWYVAPSTSVNGAALKDNGQFVPVSFGRFRDCIATAVTGVLDYQTSALSVEFIACTDDEKTGALTGLEIAVYRYKIVRQGGKLPTSLSVHGATEHDVKAAGQLGLAVNIGRHLVNLPPCDLNPSTFASLAKDVFAGIKGVSVAIVKGDALDKERAGLLSAVGRAGEEGPAIVHISWRPEKSGRKKPLAFVGKGITFDSGGLDIKDAASMRMMKKDMGGAGTTFALAWWVIATQLGRPCDFYLALAENAVDKKSFHPGDILKSRAGFTVEIDNTDAEGRLVLADVIDYALDEARGPKPEHLINLATLTGAMRIALGTRISGMFANDDDLAARLLTHAREVGEPAWRMPLYDEYFGQLKSTVADFANSGPNRFGGAISAALFLQRFVKDVSWAHFDIYCWTDPGIGGCQEVGGNGQCVQTLSRFLEQLT